MSKKRLITLGALLLALVVIFGVYYIITKAPEDEDNGETDVTQTTTTTETTGDNSTQPTETARDTDIFDFTTMDMQTIVLKRDGYETMVFEKRKATRKNDDGTETEYEYFELIEPTGYVADQSPIRAFAAALGWIYESRYVGEVDDLADFGLADPQANVTVTLKNGEVYSLDIGDETLAGNEYYVNVPGTNDVKIIFGSKVNSILIDMKSLLSKEIFEMEAENVAEYSIKKQGEEEIVIREKTEEELADIRFKFERYKMLKPLEFDANSSNVSSNIELLLNSTVKEYIELDADDLSLYGLNDPKYRIRLTDNEGTSIALEIGNNTEAGDAKYARFEGMDAVFTLTNDSLLLIDKPLKELVASFIYIVNIADVDGIYVKAQGYELDCVIEHITDEEDKTDELFVVNGQDANAVDENDKAYFRSFYQSLLSVFTNSFELDADPELEPEISITYRFDGLEDITVEYVKKDEFFYYAFINGEYTGILVRDKDFTGEGNLYETIPALLDNLE